MKRYRILMVGTDPEGRGGIASVLSTYRRAGLPERWAVTHIATHAERPALGKLRLFGKALAQLARALWIDRDVALVHVHTASRLSFLRKSPFVLLAKLSRVPVLLHIHGGEFDQFLNRELPPAFRRLALAVIRSARIVLVLNARLKQRLSEQLPETDIRIHPNPVFPLAIGRGDRPDSILFLGDIRQGKGVFDLIRAFARLPRDSGIRLVLCGAGDIAEARDLAAERGVAERVALAGWVSGDRKVEALRNALLFALPSYAEGLPMSLLEAMSAGLPVVAAPVGGIPDAVTDGVEGLLVPPGDVEALAAALSRLAADADLRRDMGQAALRKFRSVYSADIVVPQLELLYGELGAAPLDANGTEAAALDQYSHRRRLG